jgi:hypothetical protein
MPAGDLHRRRLFAGVEDWSMIRAAKEWLETRFQVWRVSKRANERD